MNSKSLSEQLDEAFIQCRDMDASLAERLQAFADAVRRLGPHFQEAVDSLVARLRQYDVGENAPKLGEAMPNFVLPDESGRLVSLDSFLRKGPVAVTFHRGHWCPYCRINTRALAEAHDQIAAEGGQVAAIIPDREHFTAELKAESGAPFPILTDFDNGYALSLNLAFWVGDEMQRLMTLSGWDVSRSQGSDTWLLPIPATFVVGTDGEVKARFIDPDYRKRMSIEDLLAALRGARGAPH
ncbi:MAG TPA: peroxiredoxin-like family protein [Methyloceanibacter sp.]|jgi:peroxiredoxin|nr:peroxiredoxin-like family protein [Methyloceanibacter sp.]